MKFEVGDKVKVSGSPQGDVSDLQGEVGEIFDIDDDDPELPYEVTFDNGDRREWFAEDELEEADD